MPWQLFGPGFSGFIGVAGWDEPKAANVNFVLKKTNLISPELQTKEYLSDIVNVVLSGESYFKGMDKDHGGEYGPEILRIGKLIYNEYSIKRKYFTGKFVNGGTTPETNPKFDLQFTVCK